MTKLEKLKQAYDAKKQEAATQEKLARQLKLEAKNLRREYAAELALPIKPGSIGVDRKGKRRQVIYVDLLFFNGEIKVYTRALRKDGKLSLNSAPSTYPTIVEWISHPE